MQTVEVKAESFLRATCDICGADMQPDTSNTSMAGSVCMDNGTMVNYGLSMILSKYSHNCHDVCRQCIKKTLGMIQDSIIV